MEFSQFKKQFHLQLDPQQEAAVQTVDGPVLLLAVPGSGKTTVLVSRIGYMRFVKGILPGKILTMTYTVAAARDMRQRFASFFGEEEGDALEFRTINGVCSRIIRLYERTMNRTAFSLLEDGGQKSALLAELCRNQTKEFATESTIRALETAITFAKNQMLSGDELEAVEVEGLEFPPIYQEYCKKLRERHLMDYDDQMVYALQILRQYPQILRMMWERYQYFCVDEAQDTSKIQHRIIQLLAGGTQNLFMVGDEDQSIYGFRAAYPQALTEFERIYPQAKVLYMEQNYRSTKEIVAAADQFIQKNQNRHPKHIKATRGDGPELREVNVYDRLKQYRKVCEEAKFCEQETAVLYRDNDSALPLIDLLDRQGIPYRCRQVESLFFSNRVVRDITDIIRFAQDPSDGERFLRIYYKLGAGISRATAQLAADKAGKVDENILEYIAALPAVSPWTRKQCKGLCTHMVNMLKEPADKAIFRIMHFMGYGDFLHERGMDGSKADILEALGVDQPSPQKLLERLEELYEVVKGGSTAGRECPFVLSTIHSSKGLEYERVILMDVIDGTLPAMLLDSESGPEEKNAYEEERRLFYVGMTRAKQELEIYTFRKSGLQSIFAEELFPKKAEPSVQSYRNVSAARGTASAIPDLSREQLASISKEYLPGSRVFHRKFGAGTLTSVTGDVAMIEFDNGEIRRILLSAAIRSRLLKLQ